MGFGLKISIGEALRGRNSFSMFLRIWKISCQQRLMCLVKWSRLNLIWQILLKSDQFLTAFFTWSY